MITTQQIHNKFKHKLENIYFECEEGWNQLIYNFLEQLDKIDPENKIKILQIKQKLGGIRLYINDELNRQEPYDLELKYEKESYTICEICGELGKLINISGYFQTLCNKHISEIMNIEKQYKEVINENLTYSGHLQPKDI